MTTLIIILLVAASIAGVFMLSAFAIASIITAANDRFSSEIASKKDDHSKN